MALPPASTDRTLHIYLSLAQYPILSTHIRSRMRKELFERGIIKPQTFEREIRKKAIRSQALEGLHDPYSEEPTEIWEMRLMRVRSHLTDFYFAYNLPYELFEDIVSDTLAERDASSLEFQISFNPELAPQNMLFEQVHAIEKMPPEERIQAEARLQEIKVVLIRTLISDQLGYVKIAKDWFTVKDLQNIRTRKIGQGKIGGKAAGMVLANRILQEVGDDELRASLRIPQSFFIGADLTYSYMALNGLMHWSDQKYKLEEQIRAEFPKLQQEFLQGEFPIDILDRLREQLDQIGNQPLIVRSSSLLEDNFGTSFAGKYESHFCPNQGNTEDNLRELTNAIKRIYASSLNPDALIYRREKGLQDYDERMAILVQTVQGESYDRYFLPHAAGVGFSRNLYRWSPQIRRDDGFIRLVWGLGTRAVDRVADDYPRLVALSHPLLHPESSPKAIKKYSQQYVDLLDLEQNTFKTLPIQEVLKGRYPVLRFIAQVDQNGYLAPLRTTVSAGNTDNLVLTFDDLLRRTPLAKRLSHMLQLLETHYQAPVDTEFTVQIVDPTASQPKILISLVQCRPQSHLLEREAHLPHKLAHEDIVFATSRMAPQGRVDRIRYVVFISPEGYFSIETPAARSELCRALGRLNKALADEVFICIGPGRWGSNNPDLGVNVGYGDIFNTSALIELAGEGIGSAPEASFGTHFFQDLVESNIYPLAIYLDDKDVIFKRDFFYNTPNHLAEWLPDEKKPSDCLRLIEVCSYRKGHHLELIMDDERGRSVAFLMPD
ncbi:MAG: PEP/pyruvate-binding domain-containing protein [Chloroflexota bacterium]|nr:PEP/pyruvate-binding domain-containing protein [Chloroflexota bacterium]